MEFNKVLAGGKILDPYCTDQPTVPVEKNEQDRKLIFLEVAIQKILEKKKNLRATTIKTARSIAGNFIEYLKLKKLKKSMDQWSHADCLEYIEYLYSLDRAPRTINNHIVMLRHLWKMGEEEFYTNQNPWEKVKKRKVSLGKNIAYLPEDQKRIIQYAEKIPQMLLLIKTMYFTLARTNELRHLQVKHIKDKIYIPAQYSKNGHTKYLVIPPGLERELQKQKIREYNPEWYVFSKDKCLPGPKLALDRDFGDRYCRWILRPLGGFTVEHTLYSWKHTGVIAAHKAGVTDDEIMLQTGHKNYGSFQVYLKSLGLYQNEKFALKIPDL